MVQLGKDSDHGTASAMPAKWTNPERLRPPRLARYGTAAKSQHALPILAGMPEGMP